MNNYPSNLQELLQMLHSNPTTDAFKMMINYNNRNFIYDNKNNKYYYFIIFLQFFSFTSILLICGLNNHFILGYILAFLCIGLVQFINRFAHYYKYYTKTAPNLLHRQKIAADILSHNSYVAQLYVRFVNAKDDIERESLERVYQAILYLNSNNMPCNKDNIKTILNNEIDLHVNYNNIIINSLNEDFLINNNTLEN